DVRRAEPPVAPFAPRYDVQMEMRHLLPTADTIVLVQQQTVRCECLHDYFSEALCRAHDGGDLLLGELNQGWGVTIGNDNALTHLILATVQNSQGEVGSLDHVPAVNI